MRVINLDGPDGNAFALLGLTRSWARQIGLDVSDLLADMRSADYEHLVKAFYKFWKDRLDVVLEGEVAEELGLTDR